MSRLICGILMLCIHLNLSAQVIVNVQLPPGGLVQKDALWNLVLINNGNNNEEAVISLDVRDATTGQTVLSAVSRNFTLGKGVKVINIKDVQPVQYNYLAAELSGQYIPLGMYLVCFRVLRNSEKRPEPIGDECLRINVTPLSPPLLNMPEDKSALETSYPQFSWLPPTPVNMFTSLNYELLVAEIMPGQTANEAVLNNTPVYTNHNLKNAFESYPSSFAALKNGQQYAWQVTARNGLNYSAQTEVWSFTVNKRDSSNTAISTGGYIILSGKQQSSGTSVVSNSNLAVRYYSYDKDHETLIRFLDAKGKELKHEKKKIAYGNNFLQFRLNRHFEKGSVYMIQLTDEKGLVSNSKFIIQ